MNTRLIVRYAIREILSLAGMGVALFWSAGRIDWWPAWAALAVMAGWIIATAIIIFRLNPDLLAERLGPRKGTKSWDTAIVSTLGLVQLVRYIVAGLDQRNGWTGGFPLAVQLTAWAACALGYALFVWATASNAFFSRIVRIQPERGHTVVCDGPYAYVRHPGYAGMLVSMLGAVFLLGSLWALIPWVLLLAVNVVRVVLEERTLTGGLAGYPEYVVRTRYRLLPLVW